MTELYPIKFEPILKDKIWGGNSLVKNYGKKADVSRLIGESWELSAVQDNLSVISNGFLAGNNIEEIIEVSNHAEPKMTTIFKSVVANL